MTAPVNHHFAQAVADERIRDAQARALRTQLLAEAGVDHRVRRRVSDALIRIARRLSPQTIELRPASRTSQPC